MNYDRLEFLDAVDDLARRAGIEVPPETQQRNENSDAKELFGALDAAAHFFHKHLARRAKARADPDGPGMAHASPALFHMGSSVHSFHAALGRLAHNPSNQNTP